MRKTYWRIEEHFETLTSGVTKVIGNSITFSVALIIVIFWILKRDFYSLDLHDFIGDIIIGITFLTLFILQKALNKFTASVHLKINELVATHEPASNLMINIESKSEQELKELSKEFYDLGELAREVEDENK
jgi:low affinity Fe/Cu permease